MKLAFAIPQETQEIAFLPRDLERLNAMTTLVRPISRDPMDWTQWPEATLREVEILITGWRTPVMPADMVWPNLKLVANASGGVRGHLPASLWHNGVSVVTASNALGWGVAEFTLALMIMGAKRAFWMIDEVARGNWRESLSRYGEPFELFGAHIGIIGLGQSARQLLKLLEPFGCTCFVYDPYVSAAEVKALGAIPLDSLSLLFERCRVVSLHAALTPQSQGLLKGEHFELLQQGSLFINTARAGLIEEQGFVKALSTERFVACLDVSLEEPPAKEHPFRTLPNVIFTPHMAGAIRENRFRLGRLVVDEIERYIRGLPLEHEVTTKRLEAVA